MMLKRVMGKASFAHAAGRDRPHPALRHARRASATRPTPRSSTGTWATSSAPKARCSRPRPASCRCKATSLRLLTKSLRPLPDKFHGMADQEQKYRQRYVDLITDDEARARFVARSKALVVDPPLHGRARLPGGRDADAAPDPGRRQRQAVRHAPQRARPADVPAHRARAVPEAADRRRLRARVRDQPQLPQRRHLGAPQPRVHDDGVLRGVLEPPRPDGLHRGRCCATRRAQAAGSAKLSYAGPRGRPRRAVRAPDGPRGAGAPRRPRATREAGDAARAARASCRRSATSRAGALERWPSCSSALFEAVVEAQLWQPTFIIDYPVEVSPLARASDDRPVGHRALRALHHRPRDRQRLLRAERRRGPGGALPARRPRTRKPATRRRCTTTPTSSARSRYGMPPTGGCGIGIDRLVMLLTDSPEHPRRDPVPGAAPRRLTR